MGPITMSDESPVALVDDPVGSRRRSRPPDLLVRLAAAVAAYGILAVVANLGRNTIGGAEADLAEALASLPARYNQVLVGVTQILAVLVPLAILVVLVVRRRWMMVAFVLIVGQIAILTFDWVDRGILDRPGDLVVATLLPRAEAIGDATFPSASWLSAAVAILALSRAHLGGTWRRAITWTLVAAVVARIASGTGLTTELAQGWVHGVVVGLLAALVVGVPSRLPSVTDVRRALAQIGIEAEALSAVRSDDRAGRLMGESDRGLIFCKVSSVDQRDADRIARTWRRIRFHGLGRQVASPNLRAVAEHEAFASWGAERAGVRTPPTLGISDIGRDAVMLVQQGVRGSVLVDHESIEPALLREVWAQVRTLHGARIAHRNLQCRDVLIDDERRPWIIDFGAAVVGADQRALDLDVVEMLVSMSVQAPVVDVVSAAVNELGADRVAAVVPLLQPAALTGRTRAAARRSSGTLAELSRVARELTGTPDEPLEDLRRITPRGLVGLVVAFIALYVLLPQIGDLGRTIDAFTGADWRWVPLVLVAAFSTFVFATISQLGAVPRSIDPLLMLRAQLAGAFVGKLGPANLGTMALNVRAMQRAGIEAPVASAAVGLTQIGGLVVHVALLLLFVIWTGRTDVGGVSVPAGTAIAILAALVVVVAAAAATPVGRRLLEPARRFVEDVAETVGQVVRDPIRVLALVVGSAGLTLANVIALYLTLQAFGGGATFPRVGVAYLAAAAVANVAPTPGGLGPLEASLIALLTGAAGLPSADAVSVTLSYRLATYWIPIPFGWVSFQLMQRRQEI